MTLCTAKIVEGNIYIQSDSRITKTSYKKHEEYSKPTEGMLKTIILNPTTSISFAGDVLWAEKTINACMSVSSSGISEYEYRQKLAQLLKEMNKESLNHSEYGTDFILASTLDNEPYLSKIEGGKITQDLQNCYIGNQEGFKIYQNDSQTKTGMREAFRAVIDAPKPKNVGDFHIVATTNSEIAPGHKVFLYDIHFEHENPASQKPNAAPEIPAPVSLGNAQGGAHGLSYLVTVDPNHHGIAIHYNIGRFGIFFCPQVNKKRKYALFQGIKILNVSGEEFARRIKNDYGVPVKGMVLEPPSKIKCIDTRVTP